MSLQDTKHLIEKVWMEFWSDFLWFVWNVYHSHFFLIIALSLFIISNLFTQQQEKIFNELIKKLAVIKSLKMLIILYPLFSAFLDCDFAHIYILYYVSRDSFFTKKNDATS